MSQLYESFQNPSAEYRGKPFWSWNGKLEKEELLRQVHLMKEMGFGGFFMHSRTGLKTEYLGEEWFDLINACADEAESLGMEAWLYDEDRWPSGIAGGMVTVEPEYRMKSVKLTIENTEEFRWDDTIAAAFSCRLEGIDFFDCKRIDKNTSKDAYQGKHILKFTVVEMSKHSFYNGYTYLDTLNRKATEKFIELTHEKYKTKCGERLGKSIRGIFTDEPHRGTLMDEFGAGNDNDIWRAPWTDLLPDKFMEKYGYDLMERLPELFLKPGGKAVSQVKWHYVELLMQMFLDNFLRPVNDWCNKNGIILTGHMLHEDCLTAQTAMNGSVMRCYEYMDYPGVDVLTEGNRNFWVVKQLSSVARQMGKKCLLSELYGCTGWQMDFESHKAVGDWQALFGINLRCHHLSWYTMEGEAKRDYPASILHQSTWWREYKYVEDYFSRVGLLMSKGQPCCDVLVLNPVESVWCQIYPGWAKMLEARSPEAVALEDKYRELFFGLTGAHIDFDYGDEDIISRHYSIVRNKEGKAMLKVGEAQYRVVISWGMTTIRSSILRVLKEFIHAGGIVIFSGDPPKYVDAVESGDARILAAEAIHEPFDIKSLIDIVLERTDYRIEITDSEGVNIQDIYCRMGDDGNNKYLMLLNINRDKAYKNVVINLKTSGFAEEWNCSSGERFEVGEADEGGNLKIVTEFEPCGEHIYVIASRKETSIRKKPELIEKERYRLTGPYAYELDEPNVCVLDMARYRLNDGEWQEEKEILKVDRAVREQFCMTLRGGEMLQPWFAGKNKSEVKGNLSLQFDFYIRDIPDEAVEIVLERPENFKVSVNGHELDTAARNDWWIDKCFRRIHIPVEFLNTERNTVELEVGFHEGIDLEALYLIGRFGVRIDGSRRTLVKLPEKIYAEDLTLQGLPFYSGKVTYIFKAGRKTETGERVFISLKQFEGDCIQIPNLDGREKIIPWRPYEAEITDNLSESDMIKLEVVLTRRNTFGPLHQIPLKAPAYGPFSFVTEGEEFSDSYVLMPSGLLTEPEVVVMSEFLSL